jgi:hypothetical protein
MNEWMNISDRKPYKDGRYRRYQDIELTVSRKVTSTSNQQTIITFVNRNHCGFPISITIEY